MSRVDSSLKTHSRFAISASLPEKIDTQINQKAENFQSKEIPINHEMSNQLQ